MFNVEGTTISISVGDTGSIDFTVTGYTFSSNDVAIFTVKNTAGTVVIETVHTDLTSGTFTQYFQNGDTDSQSPGTYTWDLRFVINPQRNASNKITNGDAVITPMLPQSFILLPVVGDV